MEACPCSEGQRQEPQFREEQPEHPLPPDEGVNPDDVREAKAENFFSALAEPQPGQVTLAVGPATSFSNSRPQARQRYS